MRILTILLISLVLITSASADFGAYGDTNINTEICQTSTEKIYIENTEDIAKAYSISVAGEGADLLKFSEIDFTLEPQEIKEIYVFYEIRCDTEPGKYSAEIFFTDGETEKAIYQNIIITQPDTAEITTNETTKTIPECGQTTFTSILNNPKNITEIYDLEITGHPDAKLESTHLVLEGGQSTEIRTKVDVQDCTKTGEYNIIIDLTTENSGIQKQIEYELTVRNTGIPKLMPEATTIRTDYEHSAVQIPIKNTGEDKTIYKIEKEGPDWITAAPERIELYPGETKKITLTFQPSENTEQTTYPIILSAIIEENQLAFDTELEVKLAPKTYFEQHPIITVISLLVLLSIIAGVIVLIVQHYAPERREKRRKKKEKKTAEKAKKKERKEKEKQKKKENKQKLKEAKEKKKQKKKEEKEKRKQKKLEQKERKRQRKLEEKERREQRKLAKQGYKATKQVKEAKTETTKTVSEKEKKKLTKELEKKYKDKYLIVDKKDLRKQKKDKTGFLFLFIAAVLLFIGLFWNQLITNWEYALAGIITLGVLLLAKTILRTYAVSKRYRVLAKGTHKTIKLWNRLTKITLEAKKDAADAEVKISKTKPELKKGAHYTTFTVEQTENNTLTASFKVSKKWLKKQEIPQDNIRLAKFSNQKWNTSKLEQTGEDRKYVYYTANVKEGTYTIYGTPEYSKSKKKAYFRMTAAVILVVIAAVLLIPFENAQFTQGIPNQIWEPNTIKTLNLNNYFSDPDNDALSYSATATQNIIIDIEKGRAVLKPRQNWAGAENVKFIASDERGGSVQSNVIRLEVRPKEPPIDIYSAIILAILAMLFLISGLKDLKKRK